MNAYNFSVRWKIPSGLCERKINDRSSKNSHILLCNIKCIIVVVCRVDTHITINSYKNNTNNKTKVYVCIWKPGEIIYIDLIYHHHFDYHGAASRSPSYLLVSFTARIKVYYYHTLAKWIVSLCSMCTFTPRRKRETEMHHHWYASYNKINRRKW